MAQEADLTDTSLWVVPTDKHCCATRFSSIRLPIPLPYHLATRSHIMSATITPYRINVPDAALEMLQKKLALATLPGETTFSNDHKYGTALDDVNRIVNYWRVHYNWRRAEAKLNELPHFMTTIAVDGHEDSLGVHFVHHKGERDDSIPLLFCHGCRLPVFTSSFVQN